MSKRKQSLQKTTYHHYHTPLPFYSLNTYQYSPYGVDDPDEENTEVAIIKPNTKGASFTEDEIKSLLWSIYRRNNNADVWHQFKMDHPVTSRTKNGLLSKMKKLKSILLVNIVGSEGTEGKKVEESDTFEEKVRILYI